MEKLCVTYKNLNAFREYLIKQINGDGKERNTLAALLMDGGKDGAGLDTHATMVLKVVLGEFDRTFGTVG